MNNNNNNKFFLIFFVIALVISISPASALSLSEMKNSQNSAREQELSNKIDTGANNVTNNINSLNNDLDYIKDRSDDYDWRVWKWADITGDIIDRMDNMVSTLKQTQETGNNMNQAVNAYKTTMAAENNGSSDDYVSDIDADLPDDMAKELGTKLNTSVSVEKNVPANEIKEGDLVQYYSQGKFPRYLKVVKITDANNNTLKQKRDSISTGIYTYYLGGTGDSLIPVKKDKFLKLNYGNISEVSAIQGTMGIHQETIDTLNLTAKENELKAEGHKIKAIGFLWFAFATGLFGLSAGALAAATGVGLPLAAVIFVITIVIVSCFTVIGGVLNEMAEMEIAGANNLANYAKDSQNDLNQYTKKLPRDYMNVTTFDGVPIVNQTYLPDWKSYSFTLINPPKHGDVLPGPGIQFLYGPDEGYVGKDQFTFQYSKPGTEPRIMVVNIEIQHIPVFNIPTEA